MNTAEDPIAAIDGITAVDDVGQLQVLEAALDQLFQSPLPERGVETLFRLFERFPDDDGYGIFWTVLHGIEDQANYGPLLKASLRRVPVTFNLLMVNRLLNSRLPNTQRQEWLALLGEVANNPSCGKIAAEEARHYVEYWAARSPGG